MRYDDTHIITHMGWKYEARVVKDHRDMLKILSDDPENYNVVAVDEQFMIKGSGDALIWLFQRGFTIVVSTLDLSYSATPFEEVQKILPYATRIVKCSSVCVVCGRDAHYTHRKVQNDDEISVGGSESYEPRCFRHHVAINKEET